MASIEKFGKTAKSLSRNPLGIIALFIVLIYGMAAMIVGFNGNLEPEARYVIVWFLVIFPILVLFVFAWLVAFKHGNLYAPSDFSNDNNFLMMSHKLERLDTEVIPLLPKQAMEKEDGLENEILKYIEERDAALDKIDELQKLIRNLVSSNNELGALLEDVAKD